MIRTFAKTLTGSFLSETGMALRLQYPQSPYRLPHQCGGFVVLQRYSAIGTAAPESLRKFSAAGGRPMMFNNSDCGCRDDCGNTHGNTHINHHVPHHLSGQPHNPFVHPVQSEMVNVPVLAAAEIIQYSGFEDDGITLRLVRRGCEGTMAQQWDAGSLVAQVLTGAELEDMFTAVNQVWEVVDSMQAYLDGVRNAKELTW